MNSFLRVCVRACVRACVCGMSGGHTRGTVELTFLAYGTLKIRIANSLIWLTGLSSTSTCCVSLSLFPGKMFGGFWRDKYVVFLIV